MKRSVLWAELTNDLHSVEVPSGDWEMILLSHGRLWIDTGEDRWSQEDGTWLCTAEEAFALVDALESEGGRACIGFLRVDLDMGGGIRGTGGGHARDGLTPEERTTKLMRFLREGSFRWKFVARDG